VRARDVLGPGSPLSRSLPGYEDRPAQLEMAEAVEDALAAEEPLFVEAGTGTGKTLAYLVPAILSGKKVVVSTATRALQEQIFDKDLPLVAKALAAHGVTFKAALMKGLSNYVCRRRLAEVLVGVVPEPPQQQSLLGEAEVRGKSRAPKGRVSVALAGAPDEGRRRILERIDRWARESQNGDRAELSDVAEDAPVWREVQSSTETRIGPPCPHFEECFVTRMRREADLAQLVVVNHHLFFADLALRASAVGQYAGAIPSFDAVIFDEAHQIEDVATDFFGMRVSTARVESLTRDAARSLAAAGVDGALKDKARAGDSARPILEQTNDAARAFFDTLGAGVRLERGESRRTLTPGDWTPLAMDRYGKLDACLEALSGYAAASERKAGAESGVRRGEEAIAIIGRRSRDLRADLRAIVLGARGEAGEALRVAWLHATDRGVSIGASPIELGTILRGALFDRVRSVVCTSATLATGSTQSFHFAKARLGAPSATRELVVASPFDFAERVALYLPRDLPDPGDPAFEDAAVERIVDLVGVTGGGAFVLCTSTRAMRRLHSALSKRLDALILVQGEAPKHVLLDRFRLHEDAVLVATMSFWEGVDVPGRALRLVVIDKIPFAVPTDPLVAARCAQLEREGGNAFAQYSVPSAAITLKQGFGRLLRTQKDAGIVAILDRRVVTRGYGRALLASLPPARRHSHLEDIRAFWDVVGRDMKGG
jgi:ATP-dependent DNA helicase DinG